MPTASSIRRPTSAPPRRCSTRRSSPRSRKAPIPPRSPTRRSSRATSHSDFESGASGKMSEALFFYGVHDKAGLDRGDTFQPRDLLLDEALILFETGRHHLQHIVARTGDEMALQHLFPATDRLLEHHDLILV